MLGEVGYWGYLYSIGAPLHAGRVAYLHSGGKGLDREHRDELQVTVLVSCERACQRQSPASTQVSLGLLTVNIDWVGTVKGGDRQSEPGGSVVICDTKVTSAENVKPVVNAKTTWQLPGFGLATVTNFIDCPI